MSDDFTKEREALLPRVKEAFGTASKRYQPPSNDDCRRIAGYLVNMRTYEKAKPPNNYYDRPNLVAARRAGERFLAALEAVKEESPDPTDRWLAGMPALDIPKVCAQVRRALQCLGETHHPIKFLDECARSAWAITNCGRSPQSAEKDKSPRVKVAAELYDLAKIEPGQISLGTVSKILKGERRRGAK